MRPRGAGLVAGVVLPALALAAGPPAAGPLAAAHGHPVAHTDPAATAADTLPRVHVLATGGTISNTEGDRLTGEELVQSLPGVEEVARITVEQFSNVASGAITLEQWLAMARGIDRHFADDVELAGVVVTSGTDTMEETAYFLDLTLAHCRPVVVTGAMRRANMLGADGPANLFDAIQLAVHGDGPRVGAVVLMNDLVFPAREVTKVHTSRPDAFAAPGAGPVGMADPDSIVLRSDLPERACGTAPFDLTGVDELPRVDVIHTHLGADGALIRAAVDAGAQGIVMASVGRGGSTPGQRAALAEAREQGVVVVRSSRTGAGRVPVGRTPESGEDARAPMLGAGDLNPQKARILLMLALTRTRDGEELREIFRRW